MKNQQNHIEISDILNNGIADYIDDYGELSFRNTKVTQHILQCKTSALGGHVYSCDNCNHQFISYNSCRDRHCPKCQSLARATWVQERMDELLPVHHFHVVFTIPHQLNPIALRNKKPFYDLLFKCVSETLRDLGKDKRWLGGTIGGITVLHTWGQNLMDHPHIHCIIPGGGIREDGKKWVCFRDNFIFPVKVISRLFRGKFLCYFKRMAEKKQLVFNGLLENLNNKTDFKDLLDLLWKKEWVVYAKEPFAHAASVVKYLGRYTHRIAISNQRIISLEDKTVSFAWKDYADDNKQKVMEITSVEFIRRFLLHVLLERFVRIRYFGFLSNSTKKEMLQKSFELFGKKYEKKAKLNKIADIFKMILGKDITCCPKCKTGHFILTKEIVKNLCCGTWPVRIECR
jgi:hypothetical protein